MWERLYWQSLMRNRVLYTTWENEIINIVKEEEKATNIVMNTIEEDADVVIVEGQIEKSIELGTKDYKRRGTYILIISSVGLIQTFINMKKNDKIKI